MNRRRVLLHFDTISEAPDAVFKLRRFIQEMLPDEVDMKELSLKSGDVLICEGEEPGRAAVWCGREHFTGKGLASFFVPLLPITEQHRILAKVDS